MRVAITTDRYREVAPAYRTFGLTPVAATTIRVEEPEGSVLEAARRAAGSARMLLITSARTVRLLWPDGGMPTVPVAAVGAATAAAVEKAGGTVSSSGRTGLADLAVDLVEAGVPEQVVFPRAAGSDPALIDLAPQRYDVLTYDVYRSVPIAPPVDLAVEAVAFASPSAVEGWHLGRNLDGLVVAVIGDTTWRAVSRYRLPDVVAESPSHNEMARALAFHLEVKV